MQYQRPSLVQQQKLKMSPQLYQSIQLMALPIQELKFKIQEELVKNPALEVVSDRSEVSLDSQEQTSSSEDYDAFENSSDPGYTSSSSGDPDAKQRFIEGALSRSESLQDHLLWQLRLQPIPSSQFIIGELLIRNLDSNGFHREDPKTLVKEEQYDTLKQVTGLIQGFEPIGTCTTGFKEALKVQAGLMDDVPEYFNKIVDTSFELLERGKTAEAAKALKISEEQVIAVLDFMKTLEPFPGREFSNETPRYVIPDLQVRMKEGEFVIILNDEEIPVLGINPFFKEMEKKKDSEKEVKQYVKQNVRDARWFIRSIHQRNRTLLKITRTVVEFQRNFFMKGPKFLVPLTLKDIADEVDVHETTVSRISNSKYVETDWGIFELKYFFSNSISGAGSGGSRYSKTGVKEMVREIIEENTSKKRLSDQKIADILEKKGVKIARRTVAKYRKELDISSSYDR